VFSVHYYSFCTPDYSNTDPDVVCGTLSGAVTALASWLVDIGLLLNSSKTQVMFIRPRGWGDGPSLVKCDHATLEVTRIVKYLGVVVDDQLSWKSHISHLEQKCSITIGQLWRHGRALPLRARRLWYTNMILAQLCYASNCFIPSLTQGLLDRLRKISKSGIRAILQVPRRTPTLPLLSRLHLSSIDQIFRQKILRFVFRSIHGLSSSLFQDYFTLLSTQTADARPVTRGQESRLLLIPFLPGPSGRSTMHFVGSSLWNALPRESRTHDTLQAFKVALSALDLADLTF